MRHGRRGKACMGELKHFQRNRLLRQRKQCIKLGPLLAAKRCEIFAKRRGVSGFRNRDDIALPDQPGERRLRQQHAVALPKANQAGMPQ